MEMHRIAAARGFFHPNMMLGGGHRKPTAQELTETLAYERIQPTGMRRLDVALACLRYELFQYASGGKAGKSPEDFLVFHEEQPMSANQIRDAVKTAMAKHRAKKQAKKQAKEKGK